jgi:hypothetical protein
LEQEVLKEEEDELQAQENGVWSEEGDVQGRFTDDLDEDH